MTPDNLARCVTLLNFATEAEGRTDFPDALEWYSQALEIASTLATTPLYSEYSEAYEGRKHFYQVRLDELR